MVHIAANVHHAGHYSEFERTNVNGTKNAITLCKDANAVLHHTSTASVCGVGTCYIPESDELVLHNRMNNIYQLYNPHVYSIERLAKKMFVRFKRVPKATLDKYLKENIHDKDIAILSFYNSIASKSRNVPWNNDFTCNMLKQLGFKWSKIGFFYLRYLAKFMK